jgi:hypothetical protein
MIKTKRKSRGFRLSAYHFALLIIIIVLVPVPSSPHVPIIIIIIIADVRSFCSAGHKLVSARRICMKERLQAQQRQECCGCW